MRALVAVLVLAGSTAQAQQATSPTPTSPTTLPSAPAALTVPMPLGPPPGTIDLYRRPDNFQSIPPQPPPVYVPGPVFYPGYGIGTYMPGPYAPGPYTPGPYIYEPTPGPTRLGGLRFETYPESAQVFVDGNYVGSVGDYGLRGKALELPAGQHSVELKADGYAPVAFAINISANQVSRFLGDMHLLPVPQPPRSLSTNATTYYVIPNCYAGTRPPTRPLPRGCNLKDMRISR